MPKPLPRRSRREQTVPHGLRRWLPTGERNLWLYLYNTEPLEEVWALHESDVLEHCIKRNPGRRPPLWWQHSAPEPRRRIGGMGDDLSIGSNVELTLRFGVPEFWRLPLSEDFPPTFESEAAFLKRHGLLLEGEEARLRAHDFVPDVLVHRGHRFELRRARTR